MYDIAIIGAGINGTSIARELARYKLKVILIEKDSDVANGTTKANSAIVHAGFDPKPGSFKARFNVEGNAMYEELCRELDVPLKMIGSLVVAFSEEELDTLQELYDNGLTNGVPGQRLIDRDELHKIEPGLSEKAVGAHYSPTGGVTDPYLLAIALAESAMANGVEILLDSPVTTIKKSAGGFQLNCGGRPVETRFVVNAAGLYADRINELVNSPSFKITPTRGEYFLLDKGSDRWANHVIFPCPTALGKGVLISPTAHGNLIIGPNAEPVQSPEATETTVDGLAYVREHAEKIKPGLPYHEVITTFSGLRAKTDRGDFIIEEAEESPGFFNVAGIESPGLVSAPAIACYVVELLSKAAGGFEKKSDFIARPKSHTHFLDLDKEAREKLIKEDPRYGRVICRCESITEGEIVRAIQGPVGARTVDGIKRRTRPGGGRCQGGFCGPRVIQIISRELGITMPEVNKDNRGSHILTGTTKEKRVDPKPGTPVDCYCPVVEPVDINLDKLKSAYDLVIIGGGPAGMAAAVGARENGVSDILVIERDHELGGILNQCIHNGFGLHQFREELTGPEYAERFIEMLKAKGICCKLDSMVLSVGKNRQVTFINSKDGLTTVQAKAVVLAMGCRERTRGAINIPGTRPAGIFSAGTAQRIVNIEGYMVGRKVVVFGSGDIGLIMARRMVLEGAEVVAVIERKPYSEGLVRNYVQCVEDYGIPMLLEHTIVNIKGKNRVEGITIAKTDRNKQAIPGTEQDLECDTILFSRGLIPENELSKGAGVELDPVTGGPVVSESMETNIEGVFACGNVVHVHDLVDWVTEESIKAGKGAASFIKQQKGKPEGFSFETKPAGCISYIVPHRVNSGLIGDSLDLYLRVRGQHEEADLVISAGDRVIKTIRKKVLSPGEMVMIKLKKSDLPVESFKELKVDVIKGDS
ncbi:MAG: FAD-dependent oxidoreductase [Bacillota bacterium]|nr:FAD-dependent oxidoreductase [Bacillota bacterium]